MKSKVSLLLSGQLGYKLLIYLYDFNTIEFVATDNNSLQIINFAKNRKIPLFIGNPRNNRLSSFIKKIKCDILLSINYLFLIENDVIEKFRFPINFHGSLLPKYRGRTPHVWAIINNETETGVTAHFIDKKCDAGDIILQKKITITENDTGNTILVKYFKIYPTIVNEVITIIQSNNYNRLKQDDSLATYFTKRTPADGRINWNWQKERIRNWVRAQAFPYPGTFTFFKNQKIVIDKISYSGIGFNNEIPNGTILQAEPFPVIKTSNGSVKLEIIRKNDIKFIKNDLLI